MPYVTALALCMVFPMVLCRRIDVFGVVWFRNRLQKERERDISEKIALGLPNTAAARDDVQFDQRLFNQSRVGLSLPYNF